MTYDYCLTPEQAKRPQGKFFNEQAANNCRYDHFTMGGGKIDAAMRCNCEAVVDDDDDQRHLRRGQLRDPCPDEHGRRAARAGCR